MKPGGYGEPFVSKFKTDNSFELLYISFEICNSFEFDAKFIRVLHTITMYIILHVGQKLIIILE